jgi:hypothetical protein
MKPRRFLTSFLLALCLLLAPSLSAATAEKSVAPGSGMVNELSSAISQITGIAISPLLGMGAVGAYQWFNAKSDSAKAKLPWFAQPWFWGPALLLVGLCFAKDSLGTVVPTALKKPLDVAEVFENKLSGLVATGAIVPLAMTVFKALEPSSASLSDHGFAAIDFSPVLNVLMVPVALCVYACVWVVSHSINILILISPFATVDAALKSFRTAILASVVGSHWLSDFFGAMWAMVIVGVCLLLAGWAFRLLIFGNLFAWDILTFRRTRFTPETDSATAFLARKIEGVPARTFGKLRPEAGGWVFEYRPWLFLARRTLKLDLNHGNAAIGKGLLHPEVLRTDSGDSVDLLDLPPRYRGHEQAVAAALGIASVEDVGLMAAWNWLRGLLGLRPA